MTEDLIQIEEASPDVQRVINSLNTKVEQQPDGKIKVVYDADSLSKSVADIQNKSEKVVLESQLLGIQVLFQSSIKDVTELKTMAEDSMQFLLKGFPHHQVTIPPIVQ